MPTLTRRHFLAATAGALGAAALGDGFLLEPAAVQVTQHELPIPGLPAALDGVRIASVIGRYYSMDRDNRWERVDIKSVSLLPNVLAKQKAREAGAKEAWFVDKDGCVTEGASTNAWIVTRDGKVVTRPADHGILRGITRAVLQQVAKQAGVEWVERPVRFDEAKAADEVFITSTTREISWVGKWDGLAVGGGRCGPITLKLHRALRESVMRETGTLVGAA